MLINFAVDKKNSSLIILESYSIFVAMSNVFYFSEVDVTKKTCPECKKKVRHLATPLEIHGISDEEIKHPVYISRRNLYNLC